MLALASFNLFWFPSSGAAENSRSLEDEGRIAEVIAQLNADAIVFQEILDVDALARVLARVPGRRYVVRQGDPALGPGEMRVACAIDEHTLELIKLESIRETSPELAFPHRRAPLALRLRGKASEREFWLIGVHFKSGLPSSDDPANDTKRRWEAERVASFVRETSLLEALPTFVLGDFNLEADRPALSPLTASSSPVRWLVPQVSARLPADAAAEVPPDEAWSTLLDKVIIDHAFAGNGGFEWLLGSTQIYAFDLDTRFGVSPDEGTLFYRRVSGSGVFLKPYSGAATQEVRAMYRVSDHRPIRIDIEPRS